MKLPPLTEKMRPNLRQIFSGSLPQKVDLGESWWTDGRLLVDTRHVTGCKAVVDRMRSDLKKVATPEISARPVVQEHRERAVNVAILLGYEPALEVGYVGVEDGRILCFNRSLLNVFIRTKARMFAADRSIVGFCGKSVIALLMPIAIPLKTPKLTLIRKFMHGDKTL
jgi:hypothetical protein